MSLLACQWWEQFPGINDLGAVACGTSKRHVVWEHTEDSITAMGKALTALKEFTPSSLRETQEPPLSAWRFTGQLHET